MSPTIPNELGERIADLSEHTLTYAKRMSGIAQRATPLMLELSQIVPTLEPYAWSLDSLRRLIHVTRELCQLIIENGESAVDLGQAEMQLKDAYLRALALFYPTEPESQPHDPQVTQPQD